MVIPTCIKRQAIVNMRSPVALQLEQIKCKRTVHVAIAIAEPAPAPGLAAQSHWCVGGGVFPFSPILNCFLFYFLFLMLLPLPLPGTGVINVMYLAASVLSVVRAVHLCLSCASQDGGAASLSSSIWMRGPKTFQSTPCATVRISDCILKLLSCHPVAQNSAPLSVRLTLQLLA